MKNKIEYLPCPFCGQPGAAEQEELVHKHFVWYVGCTVCDVQFLDPYPLERDAAKAWNTRASKMEENKTAVALPLETIDFIARRFMSVDTLITFTKEIERVAQSLPQALTTGSTSTVRVCETETHQRNINHGRTTLSGEVFDMQS
jgi:hypothetical protein